MKTKIRRGSWIVTVPLAAVAVLYIMLSFLPGRRAIGEFRDQIRQKKDYIAQATRLAAAIETARKELDRTQAYNAAWEQVAPAQGTISALYGKIHELAKDAGNNTTRFDPEPIVTRERTRQIPLTLGCTGSFAQIREFLQGLEDLPAAIWVNSLDLENVEQAGKSIACEISLVVFASNPENSDYVEHSE